MGTDKEKTVPIYLRTVDGLVDIMRFEKLLNIDMDKYITFCRENLPPFEEVAKWERESGIIKDKYKSGIPYDVIAALIYENRDVELVDFLRLIANISKDSRVDECRCFRLQIDL